MKKERKYHSLSEFYPFYLTEHRNSTSRKLHFAGTALFFILLIYAVSTRQFVLLWLLPVLGYGFAWTGHFFFEKNKPATFQYPLYSLISDFRLFFELLFGKQKFSGN
ncbi:MAG: DUF962 domain-containing protein [Bacteroidia bacterium]